jgi:hypothetical protein
VLGRVFGSKSDAEAKDRRRRLGRGLVFPIAFVRSSCQPRFSTMTGGWDSVVGREVRVTVTTLYRMWTSVGGEVGSRDYFRYSEREVGDILLLLLILVLEHQHISLPSLMPNLASFVSFLS